MFVFGKCSSTLWHNNRWVHWIFSSRSSCREKSSTRLWPTPCTSGLTQEDNAVHQGPGSSLAKGRRSFLHPRWKDSGSIHLSPTWRVHQNGMEIQGVARILDRGDRTAKRGGRRWMRSLPDPDQDPSQRKERKIGIRLEGVLLRGHEQDTGLPSKGLIKRDLFIIFVDSRWVSSPASEASAEASPSVGHTANNLMVPTHPLRRRLSWQRGLLRNSWNFKKCHPGRYQETVQGTRKKVPPWSTQRQCRKSIPRLI